MEYHSKVVSIGNLLLGGNQPIRLQSMTNTNTLDTRATVEQSVRMIEAGCEMVRITAPGLKEAAHLQVIKDELKKRGYQVPLIADIHFNPGAAELAARIVEKVRINPGNYTDRNTRGRTAYTESEYNFELERVAERLAPLLNICREHGTAIRIGTNHGSLSQRIVSRYGDTAEGMVQSALEFTRICESQGFRNLVLSMKSSNVRVMVNAYLILAEKLMAEGLNYPLHLGVTEAGDGEDGRLKSIAGIGALLARGIGDTIRVSLTEEPEFELPVARAITERFQRTDEYGAVKRTVRPDLFIENEISKEKIPSETSGVIGGKNLPVLILKKNDRLFLASETGELNLLPHSQVNSEEVHLNDDMPALISIGDDLIKRSLPQFLNKLKDKPRYIIMAEAGAPALRQLIAEIRARDLRNPLILKSSVKAMNAEDLLLENSLNPGNLLIDGFGDGLCIESDELIENEAVRIGFGLLQATRMRFTRTEFIACPSCGRTLFNIQEALRQVKERTGHLKGLKIGVMGCIVNGPGEMADADYGYVGAGNGKVTLYKGKEPVRPGIPENEAVEALVQLIREGGDWHENT
ncbi:MAG: (E)-4-hydroxy-3-methylbut-2-enyl-diphosphate synthase [Bacteroidales bacterium]|nr:(E)-4-hydroxy-3-methylbut-2-enyl-diphosphate synthase [Bacteroidales bacterium]